MRSRTKALLLGAVLGVGTLLLYRRQQSSAVELDISTDDAPDPVERIATSMDLESIEGIGPAYSERLRDAGIEDVTDLVDADASALSEASGIAEARIRTWIDSGRKLL